MRKKRMHVIGARSARVAAIVVVVSCTGPAAERDRTIILGSEPPPSGGRLFEGVAQAAVSDAACEDAGTPVMPENPSHISLRFPKAPQVVVTLLSDQAYPYPYTVVEEADHTAVTLYLPQGDTMNISVTSVDAAGIPLSDPIHLTVEPEAKLGTSELTHGGAPGVIHFSGGAQNALQMGETCLQGPVTDEFIDGAMRQVMQGLYEAQEDGVCEVIWAGCGTVYSFLDGPPVARTESFVLSLRKGQKLGLYPVIGQDVEIVRVFLRKPVCISPEE